MAIAQESLLLVLRDILISRYPVLSPLPETWEIGNSFLS
jgi:hypothetical protein